MIPIIPTSHKKEDDFKVKIFTVYEVETILANALLNIQIMFEQLNIPADIKVDYKLDGDGINYEIKYKGKICGAEIKL